MALSDGDLAAIADLIKTTSAATVAELLPVIAAAVWTDPAVDIIPPDSPTPEDPYHRPGSVLREIRQGVRALLARP